MKQCFGYIRVSTQKQGQGVSLEAQQEAIERYAASHDLVISQWFEEKQTAAKSGRPIFGAMIKAARKGKADGVVLHKPDRAARNPRDWVEISELSDAGIDIHFATESMDFRTRGGRLSADIQAVIAADFIRNLREETIKGMTGRLKQGLYPFNAPIGYVDNGGGKVKTIDPVRGPLIKQTFELYASGQHSLRSLQYEMADRGLRSRGNKPLSKRGIETMLANPFYCGLMKIRTTGEIYQGIHEPLVSVQLFETVQDVRAGKSGKKVTKHNHLYRGLFRCGDCQAAMTPEKQKGHVYYRCQTPKCATKCVREEVIEDNIINTLARVQMTDNDIASITKDVAAWCQKRTKAEEPQTLDMQLGQVKVRLERLTDALIDRLIDQETFNDRKQALLLEQAKLEEQQQEIAKRRGEPSRVQKFLELLKNLAVLYISAVPAEKRRIAEWATSNRTVSGKCVCLEPANWLVATENALGVFAGDPDRPTSRTFDCCEKIISAEQKSAFPENLANWQP